MVNKTSLIDDMGFGFVCLLIFQDRNNPVFFFARLASFHVYIDQTVILNPGNKMKIEPSQLDKVLHDFLTLKKIRRTGWQLRGIRNGESIADHCFGVILLTYMLAHNQGVAINREKAVAIAIIHEIGECRVGDIPYTALGYFPDKSQIETKAVEDILTPLGATTTAESLSLFREFEEGSSIEARFVKAIDKFDMLITAAEYEKTGFAGLSDFWHNNSTFKAFEEFPELAKYAESLRLSREKRLSGRHD